MSQRHIGTPCYAQLAFVEGQLERLEEQNERLISGMREIIRIGHPYGTTRAVAERILAELRIREVAP